MRHILSLLTFRLRVWWTARFFRRTAGALGKVRQIAEDKDAPEEVIQHIQETEAKFRFLQKNLEGLYTSLGEVIHAEMPGYLRFCVEHWMSLTTAAWVGGVFASITRSIVRNEVGEVGACSTFLAGAFAFLVVLAFLLGLEWLLATSMDP